MNDMEDSSIASDYNTDADEMEQFINRCSICFDAQLDLCLEYCRDQYCLDCLQRYITEVVKSSWGLSVTPIRCPVCTEVIPKYEWSKYVPRKIVETYEKYNTPYRSYTRACAHCESELTPCTYSRNSISIQSNRLFCDMIETMLYSCPSGEQHKNHIEHIAVKRWVSPYKRQDWTDAKVLPFYKNIMQDVLIFEKNHIQHQSTFAYNISLQLINNFCVKAEEWKQIQFAHIDLFPKMNCPDCRLSTCLQCGYSAHGYLSCKDNMRAMINDRSIKKDVRDTVKWKLKNSRQCPNCSIMINRDEGCNKVDCSYCGFSFCWACRLSWVQGCGFYRCSNTQADDENDNATQANTAIQNVDDEKTEIGVPNIKTIHEKLVHYMDID